VLNVLALEPRAGTTAASTDSSIRFSSHVEHFTADARTADDGDDGTYGGRSRKARRSRTRTRGLSTFERMLRRERARDDGEDTEAFEMHTGVSGSASGSGSGSGTRASTSRSGWTEIDSPRLGGLPMDAEGTGEYAV
jgi:hypothetical protein